MTSVEEAKPVKDTTSEELKTAAEAAAELHDRLDSLTERVKTIPRGSDKKGRMAFR